MGHNFWRGRVAQEPKRTCSPCVRSRLKHNNEITDFHVWHRHCATQRVQWSAKRTNDFDSLRIGFTPLGCNCNGEISLDGLAKVPRSRQMMVHPAIENHEPLTTRQLDIEDPGQINASLSDQVPAGLDHE